MDILDVIELVVMIGSLVFFVVEAVISWIRH